MGLEHLSDEQLQDYLDGKLNDSNYAVTEHLDSCPLCRQKLSEYRQVYGALDIDDGFTLSPDFASKVMTRVESEPVPVRPAVSWEAILLVIGIIGSLSAAYVLISTEKILLILNHISGIIGGISSKALDPILGILARKNISPMLVFGAVLAIAAIALIDYFHKHRKAGPTSMCA